MAGMADPRHPARTGAPRPPLWTRQFVLVGVTYFFVAMIFYSLMTAMAAYAALRFGADDAQAGLVVGAFVLGAVVTRVTTTPAATAWGRGRVLRAALVLYVLTSAAYLWADTLPALVAVRFLNGMCFGAAGTVLATAVQAIVPPTRRSEGTGWFSTAMTIAGAAGPVLAFQLAEGPGPDALFLACTGFTTAALLVSLLLRVPEDTRTGRFRLHRAAVFSPEAAPVAVVAMVAGFAYGGILAFLGGYASGQGLDPSLPGLFFVLFAVGTIAGRAVVGPLHDRRGDNAVVYPILAGLAASYVILALWPGSAGMLVAGAVLGLSYGPGISVFQTIAAQVVPASSVGVAMGTYFLLLDLGTGLGPVVLGLLVAAAGIPAMYLACAGLVTSLAGYYALVHGRREVARWPAS